jgi:hypothetical protein
MVDPRKQPVVSGTTSGLLSLSSFILVFSKQQNGVGCFQKLFSTIQPPESNPPPSSGCNAPRCNHFPPLRASLLNLPLVAMLRVVTLPLRSAVRGRTFNPRRVLGVLRGESLSMHSKTIAGKESRPTGMVWMCDAWIGFAFLGFAPWFSVLSVVRASLLSSRAIVGKESRPTSCRPRCNRLNFGNPGGSTSCLGAGLVAGGLGTTWV